MSKDEQAIIPMEEYKKLKEAWDNREKVVLIDNSNPWMEMQCVYYGDDESKALLVDKLHSALLLIAKLKSAGVLGRIFYTAFGKEYDR